jgi:1,3-beta-glucan synthase
MALRPGNDQPDPRNPFLNHPPNLQQFPHQYQQRRRDYDTESDMSDHYGSRNGSTAQLTNSSPYYDHLYSEYRSPVIPIP